MLIKRRIPEIATRQQLEFELDDLSGFKSIAYQPYLEESDQRVAFLFIGHVQFSNKHIVALSLSSHVNPFPCDSSGGSGGKTEAQHCQISKRYWQIWKLTQKHVLDSLGIALG